MDASDPHDLLDYLDSVSAIDTVRAAKAESFDLLAIHEGQRCLDIGCGPGDDTLAIARRLGASGRATGIDRSVAAIEEARRRAADAGLQAEFIVGDAAELPFGDASFDAVRADRTFQHLDAPEATLAEMVRVCVPGGTIVVSEIRTNLLIDGEPPREGVGRAILDRFWSLKERRAWLGYMLPLLMSRAGLEASIAQTSVETSDFEQIETFARAGGLAARAVEEGAVGAADAAAWLDDLRSGAANGDVVLDLRFLHYVGKVSSSTTTTG